MTHRTSRARIAAAESRGTTAEQLALLAEIDRLTHAKGYPPTRRELADSLGTGLNNVQQMMTRLRRDGVIEWVDGAARTIRIVEGSLK
jgi:SOS-response transcriptional repressor LexA